MWTDVCVACCGVFRSRAAWCGVQGHPGVLKGIPWGPQQNEKQIKVINIYLGHKYPDYKQHMGFWPQSSAV